MKILGHAKLKPRTEQVLIGEAEDGTPITLELKAPRLNSITTLDRLLEPPPPPEPPATGKVSRTPRGEVIKDDDGQPIVARNNKDPGHLKALATYAELETKHNRAKTVAMLLECLGEQVEIEAKQEDYEEWKGEGERPKPRKGALVDFYDLVWEEFEDAGLDLVSLNRLTDAALRLTGVRDEEVEDARDALGASSGN